MTSAACLDITGGYIFRHGWLSVPSEVLEALAKAQGRTLSDLLRDVTHDMVATFKAGQKTVKAKA